MARYASISDHGLIGDLQTAALVTTDGMVDWFCCPQFDSPRLCRQSTASVDLAALNL